MIKKNMKRIICVVLVLALVMGIVPLFGCNTQKSAQEIADIATLKSTYLNPDSETKENYPNGAMMLPINTADLDMQKIYAVHVFRQGDTKGDATITLKTIDLTAEYGNDYRLYTSDNIYATPVSGTANPYFGMQDITYVPIVSDSEVQYVAGNEENTDEENQTIQNTVSEINDLNNELMPISTELEIEFKDGENDKTVYVETLKSDKITDDKQFMITLSNPENCKIGTDVAATYTIKETREKPDSFIQIVDTEINPDTETAYVRVERTGNCGTTTDFYVNTVSGSAKVDEAYEAVAMSLSFSYGITELAIPVKMLDAKDGTDFSLELSDVKNAIVTKSTATVSIDKDAEDEDDLAVTGSDDVSNDTLLTKSSKLRNRIYIDPNQTHKSSSTRGDFYNRGRGCMEICVGQTFVCKNYRLVAVTNEKIDFTGVKTVDICNSNNGGSCKWDHTEVLIADSDPGYTGDLGGRGVSWDMTNISSSRRKEWFTVDQNKWSGEHYLYFTVEKGKFWGSCGSKFYTDFNDDGSNSCYLTLQDYNISIIDSPTVSLYVDGEKKNIKVASNSEMVNPGASSSDPTNRRTTMTIYRDETTPIISKIDEKYNGKVTLAGVYFCDPNNTQKHSDLIALNNSSFTLKSEYLQRYKDYIKDNKIVIQPVYSVGTANVSVESYNDAKNGIKLTADNANCKAEIYKDNVKVGDISWTKSDRDKNAYLVGDGIKFTYTPVSTNAPSYYKVVYNTRTAETKELLNQAPIVSYDNGENEISLNVGNSYYSVTPTISLKDCETKLHIINPDNGSYSGKDSKFETKESDGTRTLTGYVLSDGTDYDFSLKEISSIVELRANPKSGYRAKWSYRESSSHQTKTYYGTEFFYAVQNAYFEKDNYITLEFEKVDSKNKSEQYITGTTQMQKGTIISPPTKDSKVYEVAPSALVRLDQYNSISDAQGKFTIYENPNAKVLKTAPVTVYGKETHRALCYYNSQYYITDFEIDPASSKGGSISVDLKLNYKTYGVTPTTITAKDNDGVSYNDTIMLVKTKPVQFDLYFSRQGEDKKYPVNMARWTVIKADGSMGQHTDIDIKTTDSSVHYADVISEIVHQGDSLYVELFNKSYDSQAKSQYKSYGKYNTGYNFTATSIEETITYMPNIGLPSTASKYKVYQSTDENGDIVYEANKDETTELVTKPIPAIGPISPMVSLFGFTPIFSNGATGEKDAEGHDLYGVTIGLSYGEMKNTLAKDPKWASKGPLDQLKALGEKLGEIDKINNSKEGFKAFGGGKALNLQTSFAVSFSFTFCFQGNYYKDKDTGEWRFTNTLFVAGAGGSLSLSIPFVLLYLPCFVNFKLAADLTTYIGTFPNEKAKEGKKSVYLTLKELSDKEKSRMQGVIDIKLNFTIGLGIGFDGILSTSGHLINDFDLQWVDYKKGVGIYNLKGGVTLQLLMISATWDGNIVKKELFNTLKNESQIAQSIEDLYNEENILNTISIGDMSVPDVPLEEEVIPVSDDSVIEEEKVLVDSEAIGSPDMIPIGNNKYFVSSVINCDKDERGKVHYMIYDADTQTSTEPKEIIDQIAKDANEANDANASSAAGELLKTLSDKVSLVDAGDDIIVSWQQCTKDSKDNIELLNSLKNAVVFYNKETGKFHDFALIPSVKTGSINVDNKIVYNENTKTAQIFVESLDFSDVTEKTTLAQIQAKPVSLYTSYLNTQNDKKAWSTPEAILIDENTISYFDAIAKDDKTLLTYVSTNHTGATLESMGDNVKYSPDYVNPDDYNTVNSMYYRDFTFSDGKMNISQQIQLTDTDYVVAHPQFVRVNNGEVDNTLIFYKSNGRFAFTNLDTLLNQGVYTDSSGNYKIRKDLMTPVFLTEEEDHSINEDFVVKYNEDGDIYALWTTSEGDQQQIWGMNFHIDSIETITETTVLDENGCVKVDESGNPIMKPLDKPVNLIDGTWGGKSQVTSDGIYGSKESGLFKQGFDACVIDSGDIVSVYNAFDYKFNEETQKWYNANNRLVIAEYDPSPIYKLSENESHIKFSNYYPTQGENVKVTMEAENVGVKTGKDVQFNLYVNDKLYKTETIDIFEASSTETVTVDYVIPDNVYPNNILMHYEIVDDGEVMCKSDTNYFASGPRVVMESATITPIQYIYGDEKNAKFMLTVDVWNIGNQEYKGGDVIDFMDSDLNAQTAMLDENVENDDPCYTRYGQITVPQLGVGEKKTLTFMSNEIPDTVFSRGGADAANLEFLLLSSEDKNMKTIYPNDEITLIYSLNVGQTQTPRPYRVQSITTTPVSVFVGASEPAKYTVTPVESSLFYDATFVSNDTSIATVDENGMITGVKKGETTISITMLDVTQTIKVTVDNPIGDVDGDGTVSIIDASKIQQYLGGIITDKDLDLSKADVDGDGKVTITDSTYIQMNLVSKISALPIYTK